MDTPKACPACGAPAEVSDIDSETVAVSCVGHHSLVGPRDLLAPRLQWDIPAQRLPMREEFLFSPAGARLDIHRG